MIMKPTLPIIIASLFILHPLATLAAQKPKNLEQDQAPISSDPCQVAPGKDHDTTAKNNMQDLSRCNGVLKPPSNTDEEIQRPPPQQGDNPVIRPEELPPQQNSQ